MLASGTSQLGPEERIRRFEMGNRLRGFNLVDPYHCFNRTTCRRGYFTPEILWTYPVKFLNSAQAPNSSF